MRTTLIRAAAVVLTGVGVALLPAGAAAADPSPSPSPSSDSVTVTRSGTSFLTATAVGAGQPVKLTASTGEYLYWFFTASAGQTHDIAVTVTFPPGKDRHGGSTWTVDVFDGLRRRQACTVGAQSPTVAATDTTVALNCTLRQVRSWAEPWSGDPLPGIYYVRLSVTDLPEQGLGLPVQVGMLITTIGDDPGGVEPEGGDLKAPLVPAVNPGATGTPTPGTSPSTGPADESDETEDDETEDDETEDDETEDDETEDDEGWFAGWFPDLSSRWIWTAAGGILAAVASVLGFALTRRSRH